MSRTSKRNTRREMIVVVGFCWELNDRTGDKRLEKNSQEPR